MRRWQFSWAFALLLLILVSASVDARMVDDDQSAAEKAATDKLTRDILETMHEQSEEGDSSSSTSAGVHKKQVGILEQEEKHPERLRYVQRPLAIQDHAVCHGSPIEIKWVTEEMHRQVKERLGEDATRSLGIYLFTREAIGIHAHEHEVNQLPATKVKQTLILPGEKEQTHGLAYFETVTLKHEGKYSFALCYIEDTKEGKHENLFCAYREDFTVQEKKSEYCEAAHKPNRLSLPIRKVVKTDLGLGEKQVIIDSLALDEVNLSIQQESRTRRSDKDSAFSNMRFGVVGDHMIVRMRLRSVEPKINSRGSCFVHAQIARGSVLGLIQGKSDPKSMTVSMTGEEQLSRGKDDVVVTAKHVDGESHLGHCSLEELRPHHHKNEKGLVKKPVAVFVKAQVASAIDSLMKSLSGYLVSNPCYQRTFFSTVQDKYNDAVWALGLDMSSKAEAKIVIRSELISELLGMSGIKQIGGNMTVHGDPNPLNVPLDQYAYNPNVELEVTSADAVIEGVLARRLNAEWKERASYHGTRILTTLNSLTEVAWFKDFTRYMLVADSPGNLYANTTSSKVYTLNEATLRCLEHRGDVIGASLKEKDAKIRYGEHVTNKERKYVHDMNHELDVLFESYHQDEDEVSVDDEEEKAHKGEGEAEAQKSRFRQQLAAWSRMNRAAAAHQPTVSSTRSVVDQAEAAVHRAHQLEMLMASLSQSHGGDDALSFLETDSFGSSLQPSSPKMSPAQIVDRLQTLSQHPSFGRVMRLMSARDGTNMQSLLSSALSASIGKVDVSSKTRVLNADNFESAGPIPKEQGEGEGESEGEGEGEGEGEEEDSIVMEGEELRLLPKDFKPTIRHLRGIPLPFLKGLSIELATGKKLTIQEVALHDFSFLVSPSITADGALEWMTGRDGLVFGVTATAPKVKDSLVFIIEMQASGDLFQTIRSVASHQGDLSFLLNSKVHEIERLVKKANVVIPEDGTNKNFLESVGSSRRDLQRALGVHLLNDIAIKCVSYVNALQTFVSGHPCVMMHHIDELRLAKGEGVGEGESGEGEGEGEGMRVLADDDPFLVSHLSLVNGIFRGAVTFNNYFATVMHAHVPFELRKAGFHIEASYFDKDGLAFKVVPGEDGMDQEAFSTLVLNFPQIVTAIAVSDGVGEVSGYVRALQELVVGGTAASKNTWKAALDLAAEGAGVSQTKQLIANETALEMEKQRNDRTEFALDQAEEKADEESEEDSSDENTSASKPSTESSSTEESTESKEDKEAEEEANEEANEEVKSKQEEENSEDGKSEKKDEDEEEEESKDSSSATQTDSGDDEQQKEDDEEPSFLQVAFRRLFQPHHKKHSEESSEESSTSSESSEENTEESTESSESGTEESSEESSSAVKTATMALFEASQSNLNHSYAYLRQQCIVRDWTVWATAIEGVEAREKTGPTSRLRKREHLQESFYARARLEFEMNRLRQLKRIEKIQHAFNMHYLTKDEVEMQELAVDRALVALAIAEAVKKSGNQKTLKQIVAEHELLKSSSTSAQALSSIEAELPGVGKLAVEKDAESEESSEGSSKSEESDKFDLSGQLPDWIISEASANLVKEQSASAANEKTKVKKTLAEGEKLNPFLIARHVVAGLEKHRYVVAEAHSYEELLVAANSIQAADSESVQRLFAKEGHFRIAVADELRRLGIARKKSQKESDASAGKGKSLEF